MQKTRLGIGVGALGAAIYFAGLFSGLLVMVIMAGYVLLFEGDEWLRKNAVKAVVFYMVFQFAIVAVGLIPDAISTINQVATLWNGYVDGGVLSELVSAIRSVLNFMETVLFIVLGVKALKQGTMSVPVVDDIVNKNM
ncbi:MAG: hypothetical protein II838_05595 [Lachnospiraceae bacterium]|jgi:uncharacterized membrane protein|nr:hypothetical protein [Lachnospiraceae bacterium]